MYLVHSTCTGCYNRHVILIFIITRAKIQLVYLILHRYVKIFIITIRIKHTNGKRGNVKNMITLCNTNQINFNYNANELYQQRDTCSHRKAI